MPSTENLEEFRHFILLPLEKHILGSGSQITLFIDQLNKRVEYVIGEARENYEEYLAKEIDSTMFFRDMQTKIQNTEDSIFFSSSDGVVYLPLGNLIDKYGTDIHLYSYQINKGVQDVKKCFESYLTLLINSNPSEVSKSLKNNQNFKNPIDPNMPSFLITHPVNYLKALEKLKKYNYIGKESTYEDLKKIFTGKSPKRKIRWINNGNYLHFFIDGIYLKCTEEVNDGQWKRASLCFIKENGSQFDPGNLSRNDTPPSDLEKERLEEIIGIFCNQTKKPRLT